MSDLYALHAMTEGDRRDAAIMLARARAFARGATPPEVQRNVAALDTDEPRDCVGRRGFMRNHLTVVVVRD